MKMLAGTPLIVAGIFIILFAVEKWFPLRESKPGLLARLVVNLSLSALAFVTAALAVQPSARRALAWTSAQPFGLLHFLAVPAWAQFIIGFLLLDLSFYYWHLLNHKIPLLWRFHNVHHI